MPSKYDALTHFLEAHPPGEPVCLSFRQLNDVVGGLPPAASKRTWWANTSSDLQAAAWRRAGRFVVEVRLGEFVVFSPVAGSQEPAALRPVMDGVSALAETTKRAGYGSVAEAVAANALFLHPDTVRQTRGEALFPIVSVSSRRGLTQRGADGVEVMPDDGTGPGSCFLWAARRGSGRAVRFRQVWNRPTDRHCYTALWNVCVLPAFLADAADPASHVDVLATLRFRSYDLYGHYPDGEDKPKAPPGYLRLEWLNHPEPVIDLDAMLREQLAARPTARAAVAARQIGWLFSGWRPDTALPLPSSVPEGMPLRRIVPTKPELGLIGERRNVRR